MTEAGPVLTMSLAFAKEPMEVKAGACGTVVRNAEMKIVDPETSESLPRNHPGEICIRGDQIMKGTYSLMYNTLVLIRTSLFLSFSLYHVIIMSSFYMKHTI